MTDEVFMSTTMTGAMAALTVIVCSKGIEVDLNLILKLATMRHHLPEVHLKIINSLKRLEHIGILKNGANTIYSLLNEDFKFVD